MTAADRQAALSEALLEELVPFIGFIPVRVAAARALLPFVDRLCREAAAEALREAATKVQAVYDLQCPVMPPDHYVGPGAYSAHLWWQKVLGGALNGLRDRAAALAATEGEPR